MERATGTFVDAPHLVWTGADYAAVAIERRRDFQTVVLLRANRDGQLISQPRVIAEGRGSRTGPRVTAMGSTLALTWIENHRVRLLQLSPFGDPVGAAILLSPERTKSQKPRAAWTGDRLTVTWEQVEGGALYLVHAVPRANGWTVGPVKTVATWSDGSAWGWNGSGYGLFRGELTQGYDIHDDDPLVEVFARELNREGEPIGEERYVLDGPDGVCPYAFEAIWAGRWVLVTDGERDVEVQVLDPEGARVLTRFDGTHPAVAASGAVKLAIAWQHFEEYSKPPSIFCAALSLDQSPGPSKQLLGFGEDPSIASDGQTELVIWRDGAGLVLKACGPGLRSQ
jgi:hypothetical protein